MKVILCDMDGTLLDGQKRLSHKLHPLLEELKRRNITFGAASGRQYYNLIKRFPEHAKDMIFIAENGSMMFEGEACIFTSEIAYEDLWKPVHRCREAEHAWVVLCGCAGAYIECEEQEFVENCKLYYERLRLVDDVMEAAKHDVICKISIYDAIDTAIHAYPFMKGYENGKHMVTSGKHWIDLTNLNVTKGSALAFLKQRKQLRSEDIMAFGDYLNDYELLQECTHSYAMANAHPMILQSANAITKYTNEEDGVVKAICAHLQIDYETL